MKYSSPSEMLLSVHAEKSAVYGSSWCKRGELFSIIPNIARKVDRLGSPGAGDSELDTRMDLVAYLSLYTGWLWARFYVTSSDKTIPELTRRPLIPGWEDMSPLEYERESVSQVLSRLESSGRTSGLTDYALIEFVRGYLQDLCDLVESSTFSEARFVYLEYLLRDAWELYRREWLRVKRAKLSWNPEI